MNNLYTFGCSYTAEYDTDISDNYKKYKQYRGDFPKTWPKLLSESLSLNLKNFGQGASGNDEIFVTFCQNCYNFDKDDIVIVGWTFIERYRIAIGNNPYDWERLGPGKITPNKISQNTHDEITINRTLRPYIIQIYDYMKIMDRLSETVGFKLYYWTFIEDLIYNLRKEILLQEKYLLCDKIEDRHHHCFRVAYDNGSQTITQETNGLIEDSHMGEKGHKVLAKLFHNHIMNYKQI
jgi:hypothetical protein